MWGVPVVMLAYIPWEPLWNRGTLEGVKWESILDGMIELHKIYSTEWTWGKMLSSDLTQWSSWSFRAYLDQQYISKIVASPFLNEDDIQRIKRKIEEIFAEIWDISDTKRPTVIHWDANPWNIVVDGNKNAKWIDLGSARYSLPEEDVARLWIFELTRWLTSTLVDQYSQKTWNSLDMKLIKLFRVCIVAKRLSKTWLEPWEQEWKNVLEELLQ